MDGKELEALTSAHISDKSLSRFVHAVFTARQLAWQDATQGFADPEAENLRPFMMRGKLEGLLRGVAEIANDCSVATVKKPGTFWNHVEISAGPLLLTAHSVPTPGGLVEDADYRLTLARDNQGVLFSDDPEIESSRLYILLLHSGFRGRTIDETRQFSYLPGSVYLAYPRSDMKSYVHRTNLYTRFPELIDELLPRAWDKEARVYYRWQAAQTAAS